MLALLFHMHGDEKGDLRYTAPRRITIESEKCNLFHEFSKLDCSEIDFEKLSPLQWFNRRT
jgi:hypothetical protein